MERIRVLVAHQSRLMRDLVTATISDQADIEVIGEVEESSEIERIVGERKPDFVVITFEKPNQRPPLCDHLLARYPQIKILAISPADSRSACFWTVTKIHCSAFESSEAALLDVLRGQPSSRISTRVQ